MVALEHRLPAVMEADLSRLANAVGAMVAAAAVVPSAERLAVARRQIDVGRKERMRQIVRKHLRTPTFGPIALWPIALCRLVGMSRSMLPDSLVPPNRSSATACGGPIGGERRAGAICAAARHCYVGGRRLW